MNIQAMMKQAQKLQADMMNEKEKIDAMKFEGKSSSVTVVMSGKKELLEVNIDDEAIDVSEKEMLEDMIVIAVNDALKEIDKEFFNKLNERIELAKNEKFG